MARTAGCQINGSTVSVQFSLTLISDSTQPGLNFGVYAMAQVTTEQSDGLGVYPTVYPLAWLSTPGGPGARHNFSWTAEYSLLYAERGCQAGSLWSPNSAPLSVNPNNPSANTAYLDYSHSAGVYTLSLREYGEPIDQYKVYLRTSPSVPGFSQDNGPSVGIAIKAAVDAGTAAPVPAIVTDSGPNLLHTFSLDFTYRIHLSSDVQATMTSWDAAQYYTEVDFGGGYAEQCTLEASNLWSCEAVSALGPR
jgi:hypothetical protein